MNFIQEAYKGKNDWWRYVLTIILMIIGWQIIGVIPLTLVAISKVENISELIRASENAFMTIGINSNMYLFLMIITFFFGLLALFFGVKYIHLRKVKTLITARNNIDWNRIFYAFGLWFLISIIVIALSFMLTPDNFIWNFKPFPFFVLLLISFLFLPFQTSFEELLFRGYFMQGFGLLFKNTIYPLILTAVIFGLLHGFNPEVQKLGNIIFIYYIGTGLLFGITTLMDDGTELALGMHAANNIVAAILVTSDWMVFQTDALWIDISEPSVNVETFIPVLIIYPIVLLIFSKKYSWKNWKEKLFAVIENPNTQ
ncbi:MAG: CPBP family intramembrane glutamic endopeptidase [Bacteroidota bacterium]